MIIQPIVEGHGEVEAVPELLRRFAAEAGNVPIKVATSIRAHRADLVNERKLHRLLQIARSREPDAILILLDGDEDCPATLAPQICGWARAFAHPILCEVVVAHREYEAWFLGSVESLRGLRGIVDSATSEATPEEIRDAKWRLESKMLSGRSYVERADQVALTSTFDLEMAYKSCRSFRRMVRAFGILTNAVGIALPEWPPRHW
jgi:Domain of unknown function (DUF4276)